MNLIFEIYCSELFRSQIEVFLDNLNESWPEAFSRLAAALAIAPASISETLTNASCANIQRPIANFVTIAVEKLIWNRLFIGKDDDVKLLIKLLEIPTVRSLCEYLSASIGLSTNF